MRPRSGTFRARRLGKTAFESWEVLHFLFTRPYCKVVCTAPTIRQLNDILWSEVSKWLSRSPLLSDLFEWQKTKIVFKAAPERWFATARTAAKPESLAGFHDDHLLFVLDEASGIDDNIFEVVEGALTGFDNKLLMCSNPTRNSGFFKRAFYEDRELYYTKKVSSMDSQRVSSAYCQRLIRTYGEDSDVVRVRVLGEFGKEDADGLIALEHVEAAIARDPVYQGDLVIGVDVARQGNDLTVCAARIGNDLLPLKKWQHADLMTTCGRVIHLLEEIMKKYGLKSAKINVDDTGIGAGVTDRLREVLNEKSLNVQVTACHNGAKARDNRYVNFVTECYFALRERFIAGEITLPRDDDLIAELTTRKFSINSSDKIILEPKDSFKKRIGHSPDRADSVSLAYMPTVTITSIPAMPLVQSYWRR